MAYFEMVSGYCRNCEEYREIGTINGNLPDFPMVCPKCGFKSLHKHPENMGLSESDIEKLRDDFEKLKASQ